ncbi:rhodanese-like domain-containing protein [Verrucomicrobiales bacterium]|nr:rhodanese-like domain-containing protein [Verrucomicrobiales bacterium]
MISKFGTDLLLIGILAAFSLSVSLLLRPDCERNSTASSGSDKLVGTSATGERTNPVLSLNQLKKYIDEEPDPILIDTRKSNTFRRGHIPGAISIPGGDFSNHYDLLQEQLEPHKGRLVVVYCDSAWCGTATNAQSHLVARGFENVGIFLDGIRKWREEELPEERG